jgi:hypothetical protein
MARLEVGLVACIAVVAGCKHQETADPLARVEQIAKVLPQLRRLSLERPIPASRQSSADFRAEVRKTLAASPHLDHHGVALQALGLLDPSTNLASALEDAYASQAAAYYSPRTKRFSLVLAPKDPTVLDTVSAHELTHGLQDQHFDLAAYLEPKGRSADDQTARRFVVEGDATFTSVIYIIYSKTNQKELTGAQVALLKAELAKLGSLDGAGMASALEAQMVGAKIDDPEIRRSLDAMPNIPAAILEPFLSPYMKGASMVAAVYERGGWDAVNKLYTNPPRSTKQVMHPQEHMIARYHVPRAVTVPELAPEDQFELLETDVLGELMWGVYFQKWKHDGEAHPELGWAGDRYAVWRDKKTGEPVVLLSTVWDTRFHAKDFYDAYVSTLAARYPDRKFGKGEQVLDRIWIRTVDDRVLIVVGLETNALDQLERFAPE